MPLSIFRLRYGWGKVGAKRVKSGKKWLKKGKSGVKWGIERTG
jgi:hypothetical protein